MRKVKSLFGLLLCLVLLLSGRPSFASEDEKNTDSAENLTDQCSYSSDLAAGFYQKRLADSNYQSAQTFKKGVKFSIQWTDEIPVNTVVLMFFRYPGACRFLQYDAGGNLLSETQGEGFINEFITVETNTRKVTVVPDEEITVCSLHAFGEGTVPNRHDWMPTPEKVDYMVVAMHPDDDILFLGAIVPIYTGEQKREGTIYYCAAENRVRKNEALNGAWTMGLRTMPILGEFSDIPQNKADPKSPYFKRSKIILELVRLFREHRPEVVFSHDLNGEYGHWQHAQLSRCVREAVPLAADEQYDPESVRTYGTWEVKKLYLHLYSENKISIPSSTPLSAFGGKTAKEVAEEAFLCHESQMTSRHRVTDEGVYSLSDFGLVYTTVGLDTEGLNDPFEHIDPEEEKTVTEPEEQSLLDRFLEIISRWFRTLQQ